MQTAAIRCRGISKVYGNGDEQVVALKPCDLEIDNSMLTLLVGPSGSGKSTLVSILATILTPDAGELYLLDQPVAGMSEDQKASFRCHNIGIVFQSFFLIPTLTNAENITLPLIVRGEQESAALAKAQTLLEKVHLTGRAQMSPLALSKGQQQRIAIARAMVNDAQILICDEPTSSLDHVSGFEIMELLHAIAHEAHKAVVVVTHDPRIFSYADRIIEMSDGEIISTRMQNA
jgi:putative ABC transport system ATP-binding protein